MKRIGLISDTHGYYNDDVAKYLQEVDEIWHAGDIGSIRTAEQYEALGKPFRGVYGNIDDQLIRRDFPEFLSFEVEGVNVLMIHIGGYPGRYSKRGRSLLIKKKYDLFISGHSHITKVMRDPKMDLLHMNPGSCGHHGFHVVRTLIRFTLHKGEISNVEVVELGRRGVVR